MARHSLNKVVKKSSQQKAVPVRIVSEPCDKPAKVGGVDKWEAQDALRTLQRAEEIRSNKALMRAAKKEAGSQVKALSKIK